MFLLIRFLSCANQVLGFWGVGGWGEGLGFTTVGGSGCENVSHHVAIQIITMVLPFRLLGGWGGLGFTTVDGSGCENVSYHVPI